MNTAKLIFLSIALLIIGGVVGVLTADHFRTATQQDDRQNTGASANMADIDVADAATDVVAGMEPADVAALDRNYIERVLANSNAERRRQILDDESLFREFVTGEARDRSIKAAAHANDMTNNDNVRFLMQRAADNVLRQAYINTLINEQLPGDFPTAEQVREFYEDNKERFRASDRVQVWQVFLPVSDGGLTESQAAEQSQQLLDQITAGELSFADAAVEYSAHATSRQNNGYMGAVPTSQLKPEVAEALDGLNEDAITRIRSEDGWHILKKGRTLSGRQLTLEEVEPRIRQSLVNQARQEFQQAVSRRAMEEYGFMPDDNRIEQWRLELRTDTGR